MIDCYKRLAERLDALPHGYPATDDGVELEILAYLFTPEEAACAAELRLTAETPDDLAARTGGDAKQLRKLLKGMARRGLIAIDKTDHGLGFALMPFVVGFYERQFNDLDAELASMLERYNDQAFSDVVDVEPQFHRVLPIGETIPADVEIQPYESAAAIVNQAKAWGVIDCICRKQRALIGQACEHPLEVCMLYSAVPNAFDNVPGVRVQTREEALGTLKFASEAGLVHTINNHQGQEGYICNCCTCSCGIMRGMAQRGQANVVARSAFISQVDEDLCAGCEDCVPYCQFDALALDGDVIAVDRGRCVGCGQCVIHCPQEALTMVRRPAHEIKPVPASNREWMAARAEARGQSLDDVL